MKNIFLSLCSMLFTLAAQATAVCVPFQNSFYVYESSSKIYLGKTGFYDLETCRLSVDSADSRVACAPNGVGVGGVDIFSTANGKGIGYNNNWFTRAEGCHIAIKNTRGGIICAPQDGNFIVFNMLNGLNIGDYKHGYSSLEYCYKASLSASNSDNLVCALDSQGYTGIYNKKTNQKVGESFRSVDSCLYALRGM